MVSNPTLNTLISYLFFLCETNQLASISTEETSRQMSLKEKQM